MLFENSLQDQCLRILQKGALLRTTIVNLIQETHPGTTKQGVYQALRELEQKQLIIIHDHKASLNFEWVNYLNDYLQTVNQSYFSNYYSSDFTRLKPGEQITYKFQNTIATDVFWNNTILQLIKCSPHADFYSYVPHDWFWLARNETETNLQAQIVDQKRHFFQIAGYQTPIDLSVSKHFDNEYSQYHMLNKPLTKEPNYYFNLIGNFLLEIWFNKSVSEKINQWYHRYKRVTPANLTEFETIISTKQKIKFRVSNKPKKVAKLRAKFDRYFCFQLPTTN